MILLMPQLSAEWGCPTQTIYKCISDGMPYKKNGNEYEFVLQECEEWHRIGYFNSLSRKLQDSILRGAGKKAGKKVKKCAIAHITSETTATQSNVKEGTN